MDNKKNDKYYANKAIENINVIKQYIQGMDYEGFINDEKLIDAIMFRLIQLIENVKSISKEFKNENPSIPWGRYHWF